MPGAALASWREHLHAHNVPVEAEVQWPGGGASLYVRDPAGNSIELVTPELWGQSG
jgi:catechol-2,3-dioxygenase